MVYAAEDLFQKFKDFDENFQLIPGADGHVLFIPRRNTAFLLGRALTKVEGQTELTEALKQSLIDDYGIIATYLKNSDNSSNFLRRTGQVVVDTALCNGLGLKDDVGAGLAGGYSGYQLAEMAEAIAKNETMSGSFEAWKKHREKRKRLKLRLRGPKGTGRSMNLPDKPPHPQSNDLFKNDTRGGGISLKLNEIKNESLCDVILKNKNKISFILVCGIVLYVFFKKFSAIRKFYKKVRTISNHWLVKNRFTRGVFIFWRYTS